MLAERKANNTTPTSLSEDHVGNYQAYCPADHQGTHLFLRGWVHPSVDVNRIPTLLLHDWGEDSTIFSEIGSSLNQLGSNTYAFDQRGHGLSGQSLHDVFNLKSQVQDILQIVNWIKFKDRTSKVNILSQGVSCFSAKRFALKYPQMIEKLILVEPLASQTFITKSWKLWLITIMAEFLPNMNIPNFLKPSVFHNIKKNKPSTLIETLFESGSQKTMSAKLIQQYLHELKNFNKNSKDLFKEYRFSASKKGKEESFSTSSENTPQEKIPFQSIQQADKLHLAFDYSLRESNEFTRGLHESLGILDSKIQKHG